MLFTILLGLLADAPVIHATLESSGLSSPDPRGLGRAFGAPRKRDDVHKHTQTVCSSLVLYGYLLMTASSLYRGNRLLPSRVFLTAAYTTVIFTLHREITRGSKFSPKPSPG